MRRALLLLAVLAVAGAVQAQGRQNPPKPDDLGRCLFHAGPASDRPDCAPFVDHRPATATRRADTAPRQPRTPPEQNARN
jgi:hypothetical protein